MAVDKKYQDLLDDPIERAKAWLTKDDDDRWKAGEWMSKLLPHLTVSAASPDAPAPSVTFAFTCLEEHCNRLGNLHGGAAATLFDLCTTLSLALINRPGFWQFLGVTRNLNVTYFRPVPVGEEVVIECEALQVGKRLATLKGVMKRRRDGAIVSIAEHLKANIDPEPML
ncbi:thioesterase family protein [Metarhizium album ARSEF 1941]|uniref:Thioesterase family protein n=1 Tax=Metarhizium album (strain ARSEF 1941) TaxID=1081103 RepID=A0A0B2WL27_METAS|nr:thioesterase family protein [Metarhizium album ARSEF 1941]KHN94187.1 thioesterase family protein [Metarhizium album ARSEF 1941]